MKFPMLSIISISCIILLSILILLFINQHKKLNDKTNTNSSSNSTIPEQTTQSFKPKPTNIESLFVHKRVEELTDTCLLYTSPSPRD